MSATVDQLLADRARAGFPTPARRRDGLPPPVRDLHRRILGYFATTGQPPPPATLAAWAAELGVTLTDALGRLVDADLVEADPSGGLAGAYPFVGTSRGHEVRLPGGLIVQAYCAVDALGIPAMLDRDATVTSHDPLTGVPVTVQIKGGQAHWEEPAGAVVGYCTDADEAGQAACCRCPLINFHASPATDSDSPSSPCRRRSSLAPWYSVTCYTPMIPSATRPTRSTDPIEHHR